MMSLIDYPKVLLNYVSVGPFFRAMKSKHIGTLLIGNLTFMKLACLFMPDDEVVKRQRIPWNKC